jgi:hypothetical protein
MKGKVSSHNFAFSAADTKSSGSVRLFRQENGDLTHEISPPDDSAKSNQVKC